MQDSQKLWLIRTLFVGMSVLCGCMTHVSEQTSESGHSAVDEPQAASGRRRFFSAVSSSAAATQKASDSASQQVAQNSPDDLFLFQPAKFPTGNWQPARLQYSDEWIDVDKEKIHAWYCPVDPEQRRACLLYCHGNAGNISYLAAYLAALQKAKIAVLAFDYRGYGKSEGKPSKDGILRDASAARTRFATLAGVTEDEIVLMGRSLGGAVAVQLASQKQSRGLILESTFASYSETAAFHFPKLAWLVPKDKLNSVETIQAYHGPLLQSHGDADRVIPYEFGQKLFRAANEPKKFVTIPRGDHNDPQSGEYFLAFSRFIDELP
ncbi:MAG: alpha/beta hydrolase [Planctomycetaceae bacterium]|nr:alpha/beta hydrolase [Planctomycetaceae bacterium]